MGISKQDFLKGLQKAKNYTDLAIDTIELENRTQLFGEIVININEENVELPYYISGNWMNFSERNWLYYNFNKGFNVTFSFRINGYRQSFSLIDYVLDGPRAEHVFGSHNELQFVIYKNDYQMHMRIEKNPSYNGDVTLEYIIGEISFVKTIEAQYLDIPNSDWNEEDESQPSFIQNSQEPKAKLSALDEFFNAENAKSIMIDMGFIERGEDDEV